MLTIRRFQKGDEEILSVMIRRTPVSYTHLLAQFGLSVNLPRMKTDLERYKIHYDTWFYESTLHESGYVAETVDLLTEKGWTYEKDGAVFLRYPVKSCQRVPEQGDVGR